jgi:hypothetical protein
MRHWNEAEREEIIKVDASKFEGGHFYDNTEEGGNDTITR